MKYTRTLLPALATFLTLNFVSSGFADEGWPKQTIRLVVPYAAGGYSDDVGRFTAKYMSDALHLQVIVENCDVLAASLVLLPSSTRRPTAIPFACAAQDQSASHRS